MTEFTFRLADSLEKVLPDREPAAFPLSVLQGFSGEPLSFQLAYTCRNDDFGENPSQFFLAFDDTCVSWLRLRRVALVPCDYPCHGTWDENYLDTRPGLYPDLLLPLSLGAPIRAVAAQWRSVWIDVTAPVGRHEIGFRLYTPEGTELERFSLSVEVRPEVLPPQKLIHTRWFHADCLADYYRVPVFSEEHWRIIDNFMASAAVHGINMLLTPVFTPPLDTAKGGERTTVQLVKAEKHGTSYAFDFSLLDRWLSLCKKHGISYLEISHLFTQWGAVCAPKIMVRVDGGDEIALFGWHTPAVGGEYTRFLHAFLPALKKHLAEAGWLDKTWFHISDEPHDHELETYAAAKASVADLLTDCRVVDALSSYHIYWQGAVEHPIVSVDEIEPFLRDGVPGLWAYFCTIQAIDVPNQFIAMPSARNRIMGTLLYYFRLEGFLHWGFNFYNSQRSVEHIDPFRITDCGEAFPSGDPFLVYPAPDGTAYDSIRGMVFRQALCDLRALELLEARKGREAVVNLLLALVGSEISFRSYPRDPGFFHELRRRIIRALD